jgi:tetratricopeptide (TPR) repeat protein
VSIVHKALKKAERDELKKTQSNGHASLIRTVEREKPSAKRILIIFAVFFVLLFLVIYYPSYLKKKSLKKAKTSTSIAPVSVPKEAAAEPGLVKETKRVDESFSGSAKELNLKGIYFIKSEEYEKALGYFTAALKKDETDHEIYNNLGYALKKQKRYKAALKSYEKALSLNEGHKEAHNNLGVLYDKLGRYDDAIESFSRAINIDKDYADPYFNLAVTYEKTREFRLAGENYARYLEFYEGRDDEFIKGINKKVQILKKL